MGINCQKIKAPEEKIFIIDPSEERKKASEYIIKNEPETNYINFQNLNQNDVKNNVKTEKSKKESFENDKGQKQNQIIQEDEEKRNKQEKKYLSPPSNNNEEENQIKEEENDINMNIEEIDEEKENEENNKPPYDLINRKNSSLFEFNDLLDEANFSTRIIEDINRARSDFFYFIERIDFLIDKIRLESNGNNQYQYLSIVTDEKPCTIKLTNGIYSLIQIRKFLTSYKGKLEKLKVIKETKMPFETTFEDFDKEEMKKYLNFVCLYSDDKRYEIKGICVTIVKCFDHPELSTLIGMINGPNNILLRKNIFSDDVTHIFVNNKKLSKKGRIIYYFFAREKEI